MHGSDRVYRALALRIELIEFLPQGLPCIFHGCPVVVMLPVRPTERNWLGARKRLERGVDEGVLPQIVKHMRVLEVLNTVPDGFQADSRSGFRRANRSRRIEEN